jgi:hypothetical protein
VNKRQDNPPDRTKNSEEEYTKCRCSHVYLICLYILSYSLHLQVAVMRSRVQLRSSLCKKSRDIKSPIMSYIILQYSRWISTFRRNILTSSSEFKLKKYFYEKPVWTYDTTRCHNQWSTRKPNAYIDIFLYFCSIICNNSAALTRYTLHENYLTIK